METNKPIQVFEYELLPIGKKGFLRPHWEALDAYNQKHGGQFFSLTAHGVRFNQHVGVIQVGNITIEVLPKVSKTVPDADKDKWQRVLIDMLRECRWLHVHAHEKAPLRFRPNSILEAYLDLFLQECHSILRKGLVKKYRSVERNCGSLKGKLLFNRHIQHNAIHKERFFTRHQVYDREHVFNQILYKALKLVPSLSSSPYLKDRVSDLLLSFPELDDIRVQPATFERLVFDRKTAHYREAIDIAAMLLLNYRPDLSGGHNHILAILFDMNGLWEEYVYRQLFRALPEDWELKPQPVRTFWSLTSGASKTVKPDLVARHRTHKISFILDTKWKLPEENIPADADLKQMFVYNEYWQGRNALLVYPAAKHLKEPSFLEGRFAKRGSQSGHKCGVLKISVLNRQGDGLDQKLGKRLFTFLNKQLDEELNNDQQKHF